MTISKSDFTKLSEAVADHDRRLEVVKVELELLAVSTENKLERVERASTKQDQIVEKIRDQISALQAQAAVLQSGFDELKKRWEESDRRRWTIYGVLLAATFTFLANLVLLLLRR